MELFEQIRREFEFGSKTSIKSVAKKFGVHRRMVRQALADANPPYRKIPERARPQIEPVAELIDAILESDRKAPRKQRHTSHRIWSRIREEKPESQVAESTIRRYVRERSAHLFAQQRMRRTSQLVGLNFSTGRSISPLPVRTSVAEAGLIFMTFRKL